ncbi:MAG: hypothetical protein H7836_17675 [Magnetococcus sp. YQC-3]
MTEQSMHTREDIINKENKIKVTVSLNKEIINIIEQVQLEEYRTTSNTVETIILRWNKLRTLVKNDPELYKTLEPYIKTLCL